MHQHTLFVHSTLQYLLLNIQTHVKNEPLARNMKYLSNQNCNIVQHSGNV